jgi:arylsulfatase A-like enzyme
MYSTNQSAQSKRFMLSLYTIRCGLGGGVRVPGIIEWPARIRKPRTSDLISVTSDMLPTVCDVVGQPLPERPLDGMSLGPLLDGKMTERPEPICFWSYGGGPATAGKLKPYLDPELQKGTTPLVKLMGGIPTRNFRNLRYPAFGEEDFGGSRAITDNRYKLVVTGRLDSEVAELFDIDNDAAEEHNLIESEPEIAEKLGQQLRQWQRSVLESLTGADY